MNQESNKCSFCREIKPVLRQYLHAKNKPANENVADGFIFIYYCNDCGLRETVINEATTKSGGDNKK